MTGLELYAVVTGGVATALAVHQWVVVPFVDFVGKVREYIASKTS